MGCGGILAQIRMIARPHLFMPNPSIPEPDETSEPAESFDKILQQFEQTRSIRTPDDRKQISGTVIAISADSVFVDIGYKTEGVLPLAPFLSVGEAVEPGSRFLVSVKGRNEEGYYELSRLRVEQPRDWTTLEKSYAEKSTIAGTVTALVKGGLSVDIGVRAFMPGSRSGVRDAAELEKLVGQEIRCRIIKLDATEGDVVVDRRIILEEEERSTKERRYSEIAEGAVLSGIIRSLTDYGAFVDLGGLDGLLHISDIAWGRIDSPADLLAPGQQVDVKVLKIDPAGKRISLGMKQLQPHPWDASAEKYTTGERVRGTVTRVTDFGAFVELEPGIEGMIHVSEMSWVKKVRKPGDMLKQGDVVEAMILGISIAERRMSLGLKQTLGDPWADASEKFPVGSQVEGPVTAFTKFGAFVQLADGIEGMIHVSEISAERRIERPQDVLRTGQLVQTKVVEVDREKRQIKLSMKQLVPTGLEEYLAEHKEGDIVSGRIIDLSGEYATIELGDGIQARGSIKPEPAAADQPQITAQPDLSSFSSMLATRWKNGPSIAELKPEPVRLGQIRRFRITRLDENAKKVEVQLV